MSTATATAATATPMGSAAGRALVSLRWARNPSDEGRRAATAPARAGFDKRFYAQAHEMHPFASEREIERCVASLKSAYFAELSMKRWANHPPKGTKKGGRAA